MLPSFGKGGMKATVLLLLLLTMHTGAFLQRPRSWVWVWMTPRLGPEPCTSKNGACILSSHTSSYLHLKSNDDIEGSVSVWNRVIKTTTLLSQPIVWLSLSFVKTTGAGLPAGPFGILGALEGLSYVVVLVSLPKSNISRVTFVVALIVLVMLVIEQGCVPNAKPLLDYSKYIPVCEVQPGLFGAG
jgi:hypothetical protein